MPFIDADLLRKKAEHNEGMLTTLEEISLHQLDLESMENLDTNCRRLKIVYLQNNIIERMEGISKLKELEYLNLAINNISLIENVRNCESLQKLDMTLNFVDIEDFEESVDNLAELPDLRELHLQGCPCTDWKHW
jgi:protein TilB